MTESLALQMNEVRQWLSDGRRLDELQKALPKGFTAAHFTRVVMTACLKNPRLIECSLESLWLAVMEAAQVGLELDGRMAALVPYGKTAKSIPMYQGLIHCAYNHPRIGGIDAKVIHEKDHLEYEEGLKPRLIHRPVPPPAGDLIAAYAIAKIRGGGPVLRFMWREEIERHREFSRSPENWTKHYEAMALKTTLRMLAKMIPQAPQLVQALAMDDEIEREQSAPGLHVPATANVTEILDAVAGEEQA
jgi:recombination protein RecT